MSETRLNLNTDHFVFWPKNIVGRNGGLDKIEVPELCVLDLADLEVLCDIFDQFSLDLGQEDTGSIDNQVFSHHYGLLADENIVELLLVQSLPVNNQVELWDTQVLLEWF